MKKRNGNFLYIKKEMKPQDEKFSEEPMKIKSL